MARLPLNFMGKLSKTRLSAWHERDSSTGRNGWGSGRDSLDRMLRAREDGPMNKLLLLLLISCTACTTQAQGPVRAQVKGETSISTAPAATLADIRRQIGTPTCSNNAQCRSLPVGAMACGGPQSYLPYSTQTSDANALRALSERSYAETKAELTASGAVSTCMLKADPGAVCVAGTCQLGNGAPAN